MPFVGGAVASRGRVWLPIYDIEAFLVARRIEERVAVIDAKRRILQRVRGRVVAELTSLLRARGMSPVWDQAGELVVPRPPVGVVGELLAADSCLQEGMLLAPFLGTGDLHHLSESATWLLPYNKQLGHIRVKARDIDLVLANLPQQRCLKQIEVCGTGPVLLKMLAALRGCEGSWTLGLNMRMPRNMIEGDRTEFCRRLRVWLEQGQRPYLEHLVLHGRELTARGEEHLAEGLGACPKLRSLTVVGLEPTGGWYFTRGGAALAMLLSPGRAPGLEHLSMGWDRGVEGRPNAIETVASLLGAWPRPALRTLEFFGVDTSSGGAALGEALAEGACPDLTSFRFGGRDDVWEQGLKTIAAALAWERGLKTLAVAVAGGGCPRLRHLDLVTTRDGVASLAEGLLANGLRRLESLRLRGPSIGVPGVVELARALKTAPSPCPWLRTLSLSQTSMEDDGCKAIAKLMKEGWLWRLRDLTLADNRIRIGGAKALVDALGAGGGSNLMRLDLSSNELDDDALLAIRWGVGGGRCPQMPADGLKLPGQTWRAAGDIGRASS
jgi:hypothetical protein